MKPQDAVKGKGPLPKVEPMGFGVTPDYVIKAVRPDAAASESSPAERAAS